MFTRKKKSLLNHETLTTPGKLQYMKRRKYSASFKLTSLDPNFLLSNMLFGASFVDEAARETLAPYASLSSDESYQSRELEKVATLVFEFLKFESCFMIA